MKIDGFFEKKSTLKIGKIRKFVVKCNRKKLKFSKRSKFDFYKKKLDEFFQEKHEFLKIAKDSKIGAECDWNFKISQIVHFFYKDDEFFEKMKILRIDKSSKFVKESDWNSKTSQNVQILGFFETEMGFWKNCFQI